MNAPQTITAYLRYHALHQPSRVFATFATATYAEDVTFSQLLERSLRCATQVRAHGAQRGDTVVVMLGQSPDALYWFLGAMLAGCIPTFMPPANARQRLDVFVSDHRALFSRLRPAVIVARDDLAQRLEEFAIVSPEQVRASTQPLGDAEEPQNGGAIACLQHSSGTTALKKGVTLTHRAIIDQALTYAQTIGFSANDVVASWLPLYHDMGFVACFMMPLIVGAHVVLQDPFEWVVRPHTLLDVIDEHRATFCWLPNFAFAHIATVAPREAAWDLSSIRAFINCSEPCTERAFSRFYERFCSRGLRANALQICYAMAENVFAVTQTALGSEPRAREHDGRAVLSCGRPVEGVALRVVGDDGVALADDRVGEIHIRSPFLFSGYHQNEHLSAEKLLDGWYRTGDLGFVHDGELYVTGRIDDLLILNGRNIFAHEIEEVMNHIDGIVPGRSFALTIEDSRTDANALVLLAECMQDVDTQQIARDVRHAVSDRFGVTVRTFRPLPRGSLVKSTSGKISRSRNRALFLSGALTGEQPV